MEDENLVAVERLERIERHLEIAYAGIVVAVAALLHQRAEQDEEIAQVLRHCVGRRLFEQMETLDELLGALRGAQDASRGEGTAPPS